MFVKNPFRDSGFGSFRDSRTSRAQQPDVHEYLGSSSAANDAGEIANPFPDTFTIEGLE
eukprot:SAG22_NODE_155_length_17123_cov_37.528489_26_plen_59_part_00